MKHISLLALLAVLTCHHAMAQTPGGAEQELIKLEQIWNDASLKKGRATVERILADDYLHTHSNGVVMNKVQEIADTMSPT